MTNQTRREFLSKLGWMFAGGILVPYIPKAFYSIPEAIAKLDVVWCGPSSFPANHLDGSAMKPFQSLQLAIDRVASGGCIYVKPSGNKTVSGPIVINKSLSITQLGRVGAFNLGFDLNGGDACFQLGKNAEQVRVSNIHAYLTGDNVLLRPSLKGV